MSDYKLELIFKIVINELVLNDNTLMNYGFTKEEIDELVRLKIIQTTKSGGYRFIAVEDLRKYGVKLLFMKNGKEANMCFRKCYQLASNGRNIALQYMLAAIKRRDYQEAIDVYNNLAKRNSPKYVKDNNLYLYLLSVITELDSENAEKVKGFKHNEIMFQENGGNRLEHDVRRAILQSKFTYAYKLIVDNMRGMKEYSVKYELIRELLAQALEAEKIFKFNLLNLARQEDYDGIKSMLSNREKQRRLSKLEGYILLITDALIDIKDSGKVETPVFDSANSIYEALLGKNFKLALELNNEFLEYNEEDPDNDIINILLLKINELTDKMMDHEDIDKEIENEDIDMMEMDLKTAEEIAYCVKSQCRSIDEYAKSIGLLAKYILLVKLVYARDYYIDGDYFNGDILVREVERHFNIDNSVLHFLNEVKVNRDSYKKQYAVYTRKKIQ